MVEYLWLAAYCLAVMLVSLSGGFLPFLGRIDHSRMQLYLSASAGVMLGASFFHVMPDAWEKAGKDYFGWWMALGVVGLFGIERFIAPHSHEVNGGHGDGHHHHEHHHGHEHHEHEHLPASKPGEETLPASKEHRAAAPAVAGWMAVLGLTIHTFMNGAGLAGAVRSDAEAAETGGAALFFPGLAIFLAIILHKPADALAISTVLTRKGVSRRKLFLVQVGFVSMVPVGVLAFHVAQGLMPEDFQNQLIGAALAISAGTFLFIALSDLLPEVQFHKHDRIPLFLCLVAGVVLMGFIALLEDH
jgi:zinc and cadmium transporter